MAERDGEAPMHRMALTLGLGALVAALALAQGEPPEPAFGSPSRAPTG